MCIRDKLRTATCALLDLDGEMIDAGMLRLQEQGRMELSQIAGLTACYLPELYEAETYVCRRILSMADGEYPEPGRIDDLVAEIENRQGIDYAPEQRSAIRAAASRQLLIVTGGPGTGKTTSVRGIVALFERMGLDVLLCAPTGRAAKRMGELCGKEAQTIHRLLGMSWNEQTGDVTFTKNEKEPLEADAVIVLGAAVHGDRVTWVLSNRLDAAIAYLDAHPDAIAVVSGGQGAGETVTEGSLSLIHI